MKKFLLGFLAVVVVLVLALVLGRNILVRTIMVKGAEKVCGLKIDVAKVDISLPRVSILGLKVYNPAGFADPVLADIPEVSMSFDLPAFFKNKIYLGNLTLDVRELNVILNAQGKLNVNSLALLMPPSGGGTPPEVRIDELSVKIGKVTYKGNIPVAGVMAGEFNAGIDDTFRDVTDPAKVAGEIMKRILSRIGVGKYASFSVDSLKERAVQELGTAAKKSLEDASQTLKGLFSTK